MSENLPTKNTSSFSLNWPTALVLVAAIGAILFYKSCSKVAEAVTPSNPFKPEKIVVEEVISSFISQMKRESKLVSFTTSVDVAIKETIQEKIRWLPDSVTEISVIVRGCKVQYYVDINKLDSSDFKFDSATGTLSVNMPEIRVDEDLVDVPTYERWQITEAKGWRDFGGDLEKFRNAIGPKLRAQAIAQAKDGPAKEAAEQRARELIEGLMRKVRQNLGVQNDIRATRVQ